MSEKNALMSRRGFIEGELNAVVAISTGLELTQYSGPCAGGTQSY